MDREQTGKYPETGLWEITPALSARGTLSKNGDVVLPEGDANRNQSRSYKINRLKNARRFGKEPKSRSSLQARVLPTQLVTTIPQLGNHTRYYILMTAPLDLGYVLREGLSVQQFLCHPFTLPSRAFGREPNALPKLCNCLMPKSFGSPGYMTCEP